MRGWTDELQGFSKKISREVANAQAGTGLEIYSKVTARTPRDSGQTAAAWLMSIDGRQIYEGADPPSLTMIKRGLRLGSKIQIQNDAEHIMALEHGTYTNPGQVRFSRLPVGKVVKRSGTGYLVRRTTGDGFSIQAPGGIVMPIEGSFPAIYASWLRRALSN